MSLTRVEEGARGATNLYYDTPEKTPWQVQALRGLVAFGLLLSLGSLVVKVADLIAIGEKVEEQRQFLFSLTSWDMDRSIDGRWRYCRAYPSHCAEPWGDGGPLNLFLPGGWETVSFISVDYQASATQDPNGAAVELDLDIEDACESGDVICAPYQLYGDFSGPQQAVFMAKEFLKVLAHVVGALAFAGFLGFGFIIFQYVQILLRLGRGHPAVVKQVARLAGIQIGLEVVLSSLASSINESVYSFEVRHGARLIFFVAIAMVVLVRLPVVRRYCNAHELKREPKRAAPPVATPPVEAVHD